MLQSLLRNRISWASLIFIAAASGCDDSTSGGETTSGFRVEMDASLAGSPQTSAPFTNALGWTIELSEARATAGDIVVYQGLPLAEASAAPWTEQLSRFFIGTAHAHPGHYEQGAVVGEVLGQVTIDLLGAPTLLTGGDGVSGPVRSGQVRFSDSSGAAIVLVGHAAMDIEERWFRINIAAAELEDGNGEPMVEGITVAPADVQSDGTVAVELDTVAWFAQADFAASPPGTEEAPSELAEGDLARNAVVRAVRSAGVYSMSFQPK